MRWRLRRVETWTVVRFAPPPPELWVDVSGRGHRAVGRRLCDRRPGQYRASRGPAELVARVPCRRAKLILVSAAGARAGAVASGVSAALFNMTSDVVGGTDVAVNDGGAPPRSSPKHPDGDSTSPGRSGPERPLPRTQHPLSRSSTGDATRAALPPPHRRRGPTPSPLWRRSGRRPGRHAAPVQCKKAVAEPATLASNAQVERLSSRYRARLTSSVPP